MSKRIYPYIPYCLDMEKIGEEPFLMRIGDGDLKSIEFKEIYAEITKANEFVLKEPDTKELLDRIRSENVGEKDPLGMFYWTSIADGKKYQFNRFNDENEQSNSNFPFVKLIFQIYQRAKPERSPFERWETPTFYLSKQNSGFYYFLVCEGVNRIFDEVCLALKEGDLDYFKRDLSMKYPFDTLENEKVFLNDEEEALSNIVYRKYFTETEAGQLARERQFVEHIDVNFPFSRRYKEMLKRSLKYYNNSDSIFQIIFLTLIYSKLNHILLILIANLFLLLIATVFMVFT